MREGVWGYKCLWYIGNFSLES